MDYILFANANDFDTLTRAGCACLIMKLDRENLEIGQLIRKYRISAGLSQKELSRELAVSYQQLQKYESGQNRISASQLFLISRVLKVSIVDFSPVQNQQAVIMQKTGFAVDRMVTHFNKIQDAKIRKQVKSLLKSLSQG